MAGLSSERIFSEEDGEAGCICDGLGEPRPQRLEDHLAGGVDPTSHEIAEAALRQLVGPEAAGREAVHLLLQLALQRAGREQAAFRELPLPLLVSDQTAFGQQLVFRHPEPAGLGRPVC